jgi:hypothetical protein
MPVPLARARELGVSPVGARNRVATSPGETKAGGKKAAVPNHGGMGLGGMR